MTYKMKRYLSQKKGKFFSLEEDLVGWYLIVYEDKELKKSIEDHLLDSYEDAIEIANEKFHVKKDDWKQVAA